MTFDIPKTKAPIKISVRTRTAFFFIIHHPFQNLHKKYSLCVFQFAFFLRRIFRHIGKGFNSIQGHIPPHWVQAGEKSEKIGRLNTEFNSNTVINGINAIMNHCVTLIAKSTKPHDNADDILVRLKGTAALEVKQLAAASGLSRSKVASELISQCSKFVEIVEDTREKEG